MENKDFITPDKGVLFSALCVCVSVCVCVCLSVCVCVCVKAKFRENYWTNLHQNFFGSRYWSNIETIGFWAVSIKAIWIKKNKSLFSIAVHIC